MVTQISAGQGARPNYKTTSARRGANADPRAVIHDRQNPDVYLLDAVSIVPIAVVIALEPFVDLDAALQDLGAGGVRRAFPPPSSVAATRGSQLMS
jgi:hypothetical protein